MGRNRRNDFADLAVDPITDSPTLIFDQAPPTSVPTDRVAANPINPRRKLGDISDLAKSMQAVGQLQPCAVVTRAAFLAIHPEHETAIGSATYVVVAGSRRRAAAEKAGLIQLDVRVADQLASSREQFLAASVAENIDREDFDVLEEAQAVADLVLESGSGKRAAEVLGKTPAWVSQRQALLKLVPELQAKLSEGQLPVREARRIGTLSAEEQLAAWDALTAPPATPKAGGGEDEEGEPLTAVNRPDNRKPPRLIMRPDTTVDEIAELLRTKLGEEDLQHLASALTA